METALQEGLLAAQRRQPFAAADLVAYAVSHFPQAPPPAPLPPTSGEHGDDVQGSKAAVEAASAHVGLRVELLKSMRAALLRQTEGALRRSEAAAAAAAPGPQRGKTRRRGAAAAANPNVDADLTEETQFFDREAHQRMQEALAGGGDALDIAAARAALFPGSSGPPTLADRSLCLNLDAEASGIDLDAALEDAAAAQELAAAQAAAVAAPAARPSVVGPDGVRRTFAGDVLARRMQELELMGIEVLPPPTAGAGAEGALERTGEQVTSGFNTFDADGFGGFDGMDGEGEGGYEWWPEEIQIGGGGSDGGGGGGGDSGQMLGVNAQSTGDRHQNRGMEERPAAARLPSTFARRGRPAAVTTDGGSEDLFVPDSQEPAPEDDVWGALEGEPPLEAQQQQQQQPRRLQLPSFRRATGPILREHHISSLSTPSEFDRIEDSSDGEGGGRGDGMDAAEVPPRQQPLLRNISIPSRQTGFAGTFRGHVLLAVRPLGGVGGQEDTDGAAASVDAIQDSDDGPDTHQDQPRQALQFGRRGGRAAVVTAPLPGPRLRLSWEGATRDPLALRPSVLLRYWAGTRARWRPARREEDLLIGRRPPPALVTATTAGGGNGTLEGLNLPPIIIDAGVFERSLLLHVAQESNAAAAGLAAEILEAWRLQALRVMGTVAAGGAAKGGGGAAAGAPAAQQQQQPREWWESDDDDDDEEEAGLVEVTFDEDDSGDAAMAEERGPEAAKTFSGQRWAAQQQPQDDDVELIVDEDEEDEEVEFQDERVQAAETGAAADLATAAAAGEQEEQDRGYEDLFSNGVEVVGWGDGSDDGEAAGAGGGWNGGGGGGDDDEMDFEEGDLVGAVDVRFDDEMEGEGTEDGGRGTGAADRGRRLQALQTGADRIREAAMQQWRAQKRASALAARLLRPALSRAITGRQDHATRSVTMAELRQEAATALGGTVPGFAATLGALAAVVASANAAVVGAAEEGSDGTAQPRGPLKLQASADRTDAIVTW